MPFDHFNLVAGIYDKAGKFTLGQPLTDFLALSPNHKLLDAGGGTGRVSAVLRNSVQDLVVADTSFGMLSKAKNKGLHSVVAPVERLPFRPGEFDRVIMMDALHHVRDQRQTVKELWRMLNRNGRMIIVEPDIHKWMVKVVALGEKLLLMRSHFLTGEDILNLFMGIEAEIKVVYEQNSVFIIAKNDG
jgi:ubiquinone/menaquinone biosynthesis C-methylase UbiE